MYIKRRAIPISLEEAMFPLADIADLNDALVLMGNLLDWDFIEDIYAPKFKKKGKPALSSRLAFGLLFVKTYYRLSASRTIQLCMLRPECQLFLGFPCRKNRLDLSESALSRFACRFTPDDLKKILDHHASLFAEKLQVSANAHASEQNEPDNLSVRKSRLQQIRTNQSSRKILLELIALLKKQIPAAQAVCHDEIPDDIDIEQDSVQEPDISHSCRSPKNPAENTQAGLQADQTEMEQLTLF